MATLPNMKKAPPALSSNAHETLDAVERLALAVERAASARIERASHTALSTVRGALRSVGLIAAAAAVAALGWGTLMLGAVLLLTPLVGGGIAAAAVGLAQLIVGAGVGYAVTRPMGAHAHDGPTERVLS